MEDKTCSDISETNGKVGKLFWWYITEGQDGDMYHEEKNEDLEKKDT
jgi:hypothetical protein